MTNEGRETKEITLPKSGKKVTIKTYFNIAEKRQLQKNLFAGLKIDEITDESKFEYDKLMEHQDMLIKIGVVSFDGSDKDNFDRIMDLQHEEDFKMIVDEVSSVQRTEQKKTK